LFHASILALFLFICQDQTFHGFLRCHPLPGVYLGLLPLASPCFCSWLYHKEGYLIYGRQALGNVPALGYFLAGYLLWLTALDRESWQRSVGAGLLFALAIVTKGQYILLIPSILSVALLDAVYFRKIGLKRILLLLITIIF
jgi:hypothetical protein